MPLLTEFSMESQNFDTEGKRQQFLVRILTEQLGNLTKHNDEVVYLDTEYIHAALAENRYRPTAADWKEVVQIGAVKWNHRLHRATDSFVRLIQPKIHVDDMSDEKITDFEKITPLKWSEIIEKGSDFIKVYEELRAFIGTSAVVVMLGDGDILKGDCDAHKVSIADSLVSPTRLKPILCSIDDNYYSKLWSGMLYREVGTSLEDVLAAAQSSEEMRSEHDGLFDATSMAIFVDKTCTH